MAAITVGELRDALPPGTALVGGAGGLGRAVSGTTTFRARIPAFPTLHGGEVAIVPLALLHQVDPQTHRHLDRLVTQLAGAGIAAIALVNGVPSPGAEDGLSAESREAAAAASEAHALPLFIAPPGTTADQVDLALHRHLAGQRAALLQRSQELQQEFAQLALSGRGITDIVSRLASVSGFPAAWEIPTSLEPVAWALPSEAWAPAKDLARSGADLPTVLRAARLPLQRWSATANGALSSGDVAVLPLRADATASAGTRVGTGGPWRRLVIAVRNGELTAGFLSILAREDSASGEASEARLALSAAGLAMSIEIMRARTASEAQGSALAGLLHEWLAGRLAEDALQARSGQLGLTLEPPFAVVVVEASGVQEAESRSLTSAFGAALGAASASAPLTAAVGEGQTALIVSVATGETLAGGAVALHAALVRRVGEGAEETGAGPAFAGIGRVAVTAGDVPRAFDEARRSLAVARRLGGKHRVAYFGTLGAYRVLAATDPVELAGFRAETLGALLGPDDRSSADLLRTLEAYLACGGSPQETAQRLHTHRNTVLYRLQRIGDVLGMDVRAPETQFTLWLALRAADVLGDPASATVAAAQKSPAGAVTPAASTRRTGAAA